MKYARYIFMALGIALIVALGIMVKDYFPDTAVWVLDIFVACIAYATAVHSFSAIMAPPEKVSAGVAGMGVNMYISSLYAVLAVIVGVIGFVVPIDFKWQLLIQLALIVMLASGIFGSLMANQRLNSVEAKSQMNHAAKQSLALKGQQLKLAAITMKNQDLKGDIGKIAERLGYISPSHSPMAQAIEDQLSQSIDTLEQMIRSSQADEQIEQEIVRAQELLKQRLQTY